MNAAIQFIKDAVIHLFYPHICAGCGSDQLSNNTYICIACLLELPQTEFEKYSGNPIENMFAGRIHVNNATAQYYFSKQSILQHIIHQFKYYGCKELGHQLGILMGLQLAENNRWLEPEALIPMPLFESRKRKRGYNQAEILCNGISEVLGIPVWNDIIERTVATDTQTHKSRIDRWSNMQEKFMVTQPDKIQNKNIILVDDVVTTGATLEACGQALLKESGVTLNMVALCFSNS